MPDPDLLPLADGARKLGIPVRTAYDLAGRGEMPGALKLGARWYFAPALAAERIRQLAETTQHKRGST